jgi:hypothetical protein
MNPKFQKDLNIDTSVHSGLHFCQPEQGFPNFQASESWISL